MRRLKLVIAYDGAPWKGWQSQPGGTGVQDVVESALKVTCGSEVRLHGSGRTDAGVHAAGQTAHADVPGEMEPAQWLRALNARLPGSIRVMESGWAAENFHARFDAESKEYRYRLWLGQVLPPALFGKAWLMRRPVDLSAVNACLSLLPGRWDFRRMCANNGVMRTLRKRGRDPGPPDTVREIFTAGLCQRGSEVELRFVGGGFLYRQVRMMVAATLRVGCGQETFAWWKNLLEEPTARPFPLAAPADGLTLFRVGYGD